jgi:hypothetical protein
MAYNYLYTNLVVYIPLLSRRFPQPTAAFMEHLPRLHASHARTRISVMPVSVLSRFHTNSFAVNFHRPVNKRPSPESRLSAAYLLCLLLSAYGITAENIGPNSPASPLLFS